MIKEEIVSGNCPTKFRASEVIEKPDPNDILSWKFGLIEDTLAGLLREQVEDIQNDRYYIVYDTENMIISQCINITLFDQMGYIKTVEDFKRLTGGGYRPYESEEVKLNREQRRALKKKRY